MKNYLWIIILIIFSFSCEKNDPSVESDAVIPAYIGNFWVYTDSIFDEGELQIHTDTVSITDTVIIDNEKWFELEGYSQATSILERKFLVRDNKICTLQSNWGSSIVGTIFIPPTTDTAYYAMLVGGDSFMTYSTILFNKKYSTLNNTFNRYALYECMGTDKNIYVIVPGVGIVKRIFGDNNTSTLIGYSVRE